MQICSQPKCPFATTGACLEGHTANCPHLNSAPQASEPNKAPVEKPADKQPKTEGVRFYSGEKLNSLEASRITQQFPTVCVLCAGEQKVGKTTFLARIGELFRNGKFTNWLFAASKTLCAFERISWHATMVSGGKKPDTKRTHHSERDTFFHLRVQRDQDELEEFHLLLSDLPGESYPTVIAKRDFCSGLCSVERADHLALFIDGAAILNSAKRHVEKDNAFGFLTQVAKCLKHPKHLQIQIIFSRWDRIERSGNDAALKFCDDIERKIKEKFGDVFASLKFFKVAARPSGKKASDNEIFEIFELWLGPWVLPSVKHDFVNKQFRRDFTAFGQI